MIRSEADNGTQNRSNAPDADEVRQAVKDALTDRIVTDVYADSDAQIVAVELGGQYSAETADEIAREDIEPVLSNGWDAAAYVGPSIDVEQSRQPYRMEGLVIIPLHGQEIGQDDIRSYVIGLVASNLDEYLNARRIATHEIPSTYGEWDDEFADDGDGVYVGPVGVARDEDEAIRFNWASRYARACVRILDGGGRFDSDDYRFHECVPFAVMEGPDAALAIAPCHASLDADDVDEPEFTYRSDGAGCRDFQLID